MTVLLTSLRAFPLTATFDDIYGGKENIPAEIRRPSSHFQSIPRRGQFCAIVVCHASDGSVGYGECFGLPTPYPAAEIVNRVAAETLIGKPIRTPKQMTEDLRRFFLALGHSKGPAMEALSGIDIALWDLLARREGKPLAVALGSEPMSIPTYVSPVPFLPTPEASARSAVSLVKGFSAVKLKIGRSAREDIPHIVAVREAIGPDIALMLDANCGYTLEDAKTLVREVAPLNIRWLEEPLPPEDLRDTRSLATISEIALAGGENEFTPEALARLVTEAGLSVIQPNITRSGGVSGMLEIDQLAEQHKVCVAPHGVGGCIAVAATLHVAAVMSRFEVFEVNRLPNPLRDALGKAATFANDGTARGPTGIGHGSPIERNMNLYCDPVVRAAE